jgi:hypothetical protein
MTKQEPSLDEVVTDIRKVIFKGLDFAVKELKLLVTEAADLITEKKEEK